MKLGELQKGEKFKFKNRIHTKLNKVNSHTKFEHDIFDCMDDEGRHRPFRDDTPVEPLQQRLEVLNYEQKSQPGKEENINKEDA